MVVALCGFWSRYQYCMKYRENNSAKCKIIDAMNKNKSRFGVFDVHTVSPVYVAVY